MKTILSPAFAAPASATQTANDEWGTLPEWKLDDLYPGIASEAFGDDVKWCLETAATFEDRHAGKLLDTVRKNPRDLALVISEYEEIEERIGKVLSYAGLVYAGDSANPDHAKFYGDAQEKMTNAGSHLLFFTLELNQIGSKELDQAIKADASLAYYSPWLEDLRKDKPFQLEEKLEQLFHEKSITGRGAWNRLFDETMSSLEFTIDGEGMQVESALNRLQHEDRTKRQQAATEISRVLDANIRTFTLVTNTLAKDKEISDRWRGFDDIADSRHLANRVEREVVDALVEAVEGALPAMSHRYYT
ncbi:MAG: oligoendopeptidase F, partial [Pseudomonadota bacterium]